MDELSSDAVGEATAMEVDADKKSLPNVNQKENKHGINQEASGASPSSSARTGAQRWVMHGERRDRPNVLIDCSTPLVPCLLDSLS